MGTVTDWPWASSAPSRVHAFSSAIRSARLSLVRSNEASTACRCVSVRMPDWCAP